MREKRLNSTAVLRGLPSKGEVDAPSSTADPDQPRSPARRRFLWQSIALGASPAFASPPPSEDLVARQTANGFAFLYRGRVLWAADVRWLASPASCRTARGHDRAEVTLSRAFVPGCTIACSFTARITHVGRRFVITVDHALGSGTANLDAWLDGRATLSLGRVFLPSNLSAASNISVAQESAVETFLLPDLSLRFQSEASFRVHGREMAGTFDECIVRQATNPDARLIPGTFDRVAHITLSAKTSPGAKVRPLPAGGKLQCAAFDTSRLRFELLERMPGKTAFAWLASAETPVMLKTISARWIDAPRITLLAQELSFGRVISDAPASLLVATTSHATLQTADLALSGDCVDCAPLMVTERDAGIAQRLRRSVVWRRGALRDSDGVSMQLHFLENSTPAQPHAITHLLDAIPWHSKRISLAGVVIEFTRPDDGLWLRASLEGFSLMRRFGRYVVALDGTRRTSETANPPLLHLRLPPQSFSEQAFYRAPSDPSPHWPPQESESQSLDPKTLARQGITATSDKKTAETLRTRQNPKESEKISGDTLSALRVSGESVLRFALRDGHRESFDLSLAALLDTDRWQFHVAPQAKHVSEVAGPATLENVTDIELPWRVHLSPDERARLATSPQRLSGGNGFHPLFYLRPYAPPGKPAGAGRSAVDLPVRAIASPDHGPLPWLHFGAIATVSEARLPQDPVRTALDEQDRNELVWLTGRWGQPALDGTANVSKGVYIPQPIRAQRLLLTAFGASMRSSGYWDPPSLKLDARADGVRQVAMSIEEWDHVSTLGRSHLDRVIYRGYLLPFGFRVALIKMTTREVEWHPVRGYLAVPVQRYFIRVEDPVKLFPCAVGQPLASLNGFFQPERFALTLDHDLQIDQPATWDICDLGQDAFWVCAPTGNKDRRYPFSLRIGNDGAGTVHMAFVSNRIVHDVGQMNAVATLFNAKGTVLSTDRAKITFAPSVRQGDTRFTTSKATIKTVVNDTLINSALLESNHQPPFYPLLDTAEVELDAIQRTTTQQTPQLSTVSYARLYQAVGFVDGATDQPSSHQGNPAEVFLTLHTPASMHFTGNGERAGGVATPNMTANALSRSKGLISGFVDLPGAQGVMPSAPVQKALREAARAGKLAASASIATQVGGFDNPFSTDAKLLGIIPLREVFKVVGLDDLPKFVESIDEAIAADAGDVAAKLSEFGVHVQQSAAELTMSLDTQMRFVVTPEGKQLRQNMVDIDRAASQLATSQAPLADRLQLTIVVAQRLRALDAALRAIAAHPESLLNLDAIEKVRDRIVTPLEDAVKDARAKAQAQLTQACDEANRQIAAFVTELENEASDAYEAIADQFSEQVLEYAAVHRNELVALRDSVQRADDVLTHLCWLAHSYQEYYSRGFGLPDAVQRFMDSAQAQDVANALNQVKAQMQKIERAPEHWRTLCKNAIAAGMSLEDAWNRKKPDFPRETKACAAPFIALSKRLHDLVASGHADDITDEMLLAPFNRAHQVLMATIAAVEQVPDTLQLLGDEAVDSARANLQVSIDVARNDVAGLLEALRALRDALTKNQWNPLVSSTLMQYVDQSLNALNLLNVGGQTMADALHAALGVCEALGNLFDLRWQGTQAAALGAYAPRAISEPAERVRLTIIAIDAKLRTIAQTAWTAIDRILAAIAALPLPSDDLKDLVGEKLIDRTKGVIGYALDLHNRYLADEGANGPDSAALVDLSTRLDGLIEEINDWVRLIQTLPAQIEARVLDRLRNEVQALLASVVPARIKADLHIERAIDSYDNVFVAGHNREHACLTLSAKVETDLIARTTTSSFQGALTNFEINLFGMVVLGISRLAFTAENGKMHLEAPQIDHTTIAKPLDFLNGLDGWMNGSNGPFMIPLPNGIRAGYRMSGSDILLGPLLVVNFTFEAAVELPFDDRAAIFSVAVGHKDDPCLVSLPPYGGGMFFEMQMAGSRLVALSAAVEYGLVGGFNRGVIKGVGRIVIGLYMSQTAQGGLLEGYFYAGGYARIMGIVSVCVDLRISLTYTTAGRVDGAGRFSVSIGVGLFSWTLRYTVEYHASAKANLEQQDKAGALRAAVARTSSQDSDDLALVELRDHGHWDAYRAAFALDDMHASAEL